MRAANIKTFTSGKLALQSAIMKDRRLSSTDYRVATALLSHANAETGAIFPSQTLIALEVGVSIPTVKRAVRSLVNTGWLAVERTNRHCSNRYEFLTDQVATIEDGYAESRDMLAESRELRRSNLSHSRAEGSWGAVGSSLIPLHNSEGSAAIPGGITDGPSEGSSVISKHLDRTPAEEHLKFGREQKTIHGAMSGRDEPSKHGPSANFAVTSGKAPAAPSIGQKPLLRSPVKDRRQSPWERPRTSAVRSTASAIFSNMTPERAAGLMILQGTGTHWDVADATGIVLGSYITQTQAFYAIAANCAAYSLSEPAPKFNPNDTPDVPPNFEKIAEEHYKNQSRRTRIVVDGRGNK